MKPAQTPHLTLYRWTGFDPHGQKVSGESLASREGEIRSRLREQNIRVTKISRRPRSLSHILFKRIKPEDITLMTRQLATMLTTGVPIVHALKLVAAHHDNITMKCVMAQITQSVEAGTSVTESLRAAAPHFDDLYVDLIESGEQSGHLAEVFVRVATHREKSQQLRTKVGKALLYPAMVLSVAIGVSYLMLTRVIPEFEHMFNSFGAELPWFTRQVLNLSHTVQSGSARGGLVVLVLAVILKIARKKSHSLRLLCSRLSLSCPLIGTLLTKAAIARFSRTLATSFGAGIPILSGLQTSAKTAGNVYFECAIVDISRQTATGMPVYVAMKTTGAFPELVWQMVMIGEECGNLDDMLHKVATIYESDVDNVVDNLSKILEPLIIILLGTLIGSLVVAMYLPIFNLMSVLG